MKIHKVGRIPTLVCAAISVAAGIAVPFLFIPGAIITALCAFFFRDPDRVSPIRDGLILAPADGAVLCVDEAIPPPELQLSEEPLPRVGIFLDLNDVHVNRVPVSGRVLAATVREGEFIRAWQPASAERNARRAAVIETVDGQRVVVVQLVGFIARRIFSDLSPGQTVTTGSRFGVIAFGSRVDVYLPPSTSALVGVGQRVVGGETVIADLLSRERPRAFETR